MSPPSAAAAIHSRRLGAGVPLQPQPGIHDQARGEKTHGRQQERRNFVDPYADRQECRSPDEINHGEGKQDFPGSWPAFSFHLDLL